MHPYPPPQPSFLEREYGGVPLYVHLIAVGVSCGVYALILPFVLLFSWIEGRIDRAVNRVVDPIVDRLLKAALMVVAVPAYLIYEAGKWLYQRYSRRAAKP